jgi:hypothetical protein
MLRAAANAGVTAATSRPAARTMTNPLRNN